VWPSKCAACSLTHVGLPPLASRLAGTIPPSLGTVLRRLPGKAGTVLGMSALVVEYRKMQTELLEIVERFVVLNETAHRMLLADGTPASKLALNRLGLSQTGVTRKPGPDLQPTRRPVHFGFAGRLHPAKGLTQIARAVIAIPRDIDFRVDIRAPILDEGGRSIVAELKGIVAGDPRIRFEAAVSSAEIPAVLTKLDALLSPSLSFENGPTIALEAMAVGTPIIATRVGNLAELIEDGVNGRLVDVGDVGQLSAALREAATSPATTIDVWRRTLPPVRTMDDIAQDYLAMYAA
jgi:glycosyltransferase involved in cell wall biosynthesis